MREVKDFKHFHCEISSVHHMRTNHDLNLIGLHEED
jgi:hypothetical protein